MWMLSEEELDRAKVIFVSTVISEEVITTATGIFIALINPLPAIHQHPFQQRVIFASIVSKKAANQEHIGIIECPTIAR